jgi:hypothetical protein
MVTPQDVVIALSNSGESNEILALIPVLKRLQVPLICMTSRPESSMARAADIHLCVKVPKKPVRSVWRRRPAPPPRWSWAMRLPLRCWKPVVLRRKISRFPTLAARWGASCCCG